MGNVTPNNEVTDETRRKLALTQPSGNATISGDNHGKPSSDPPATTDEQKTAANEEIRDPTTLPLLVGNSPNDPDAASHDGRNFPVEGGRKADSNEIEVLHTNVIDDDKSEAIKAAALRLTGTKTHKQILSFLAQNPNGVTGSQVTKNVPKLVWYIQQCAKERGEVYFSPIILLSSVEGVLKTRVSTGRIFFFLNDRKLQGENIGKEGKQVRTTDCAAVVADRKLEDNGFVSAENHARTTDAAASVELLGLLEKAYRGRPWPQTRKQLNQFLLSLDLQGSPAIVSWLEYGIASDLSKSKKNKEAIKRTMHQFKQMGCLKGTNNALTWKLTVVKKIVEENKSGIVQSQPSELQAPPCPFQPNGNVPVVFVDTTEKFESILLDPPFTSTPEMLNGNEVVVAIDCEGVPENLFLVQVGTLAATYVFDGVKLGEAELCTGLRPLLSNPEVTKLFHDLHNDAVALSEVGGVTQLNGTLDTQLALEWLSGDIFVGFNRMLQQLGIESHPLKQSMKRKMDDGRLFAQRPLPADALEYAALDASLLYKAKDSLFAVLGPTRDAIQRASDFRATMAPASGGLRQMCFDVANSYVIASRELLEELRPQDMLRFTKLEVSDDTEILLSMLPNDLRENLSGRTRELSDIVLDKGREPIAWINGDRVHIGKNDQKVSKEDVEAIVEQLGGFGSDNRAGLEQQLHRISAMRNRQQDIIGLTLRVGRHVSGNAVMISDLLFADCTQSILFLGEPGSGKTTVVREVTKQLAERFNVCIVDTSNEIAGDGDIPHPCVGYARRMMVPSLDRQSAVMVECVQNHTPEVMVIDEIGRSTEVEAARTCKQRGVRLIASAHGDLRKLIKNPKLRGLVGGVETVTLGDTQAKQEAKKSGGGLQKLKAQRAGPPTFDIIVELRRGAQHEWRIILDVGEAVDNVLEGQHYKAQRRIRNPETGALAVALERA